MTLDLILEPALAALFHTGLDRVRELWADATSRQQQELREARDHAVSKAERRIRAEKLKSRLLALYYPDSTLQARNLGRFSFSVNGSRVSTDVVTRKEWLGLNRELRNSRDKFNLVSGPNETPMLSDREGMAVLAELERKGIRAVDAPAFRLLDASISRKRVQASFALARYLQHRVSLGTLEDELTHALVDADLSPQTAYKKKNELLPWRGRFLPSVEGLLDFQSRLCIGGVDVCVALQRPRPENDFLILVKRRSKNVATGRSMLSLAPSACHQPMSEASAREELSPANTVYREMYEELWAGNEVSDTTGYIDPQWFFSKCPALDWFRKNPGHFGMELVCFGLNLVDGHYVLGILVVINSLDFLKEFGKTIFLNWEFNDPSTPRVSTMDSQGIGELLIDPTWSESSLFAFVESLRRLSKTERSRVKLPTIRQDSP